MSEKKIVSSSGLTEMIRHVKSQYLDVRGVGIRKFSLMTGIQRTRLTRLFSGTEQATVSELTSINDAINKIEARHLEIKKRRGEEEISAVTIEDTLFKDAPKNIKDIVKAVSKQK